MARLYPRAALKRLRKFVDAATPHGIIKTSLFDSLNDFLGDIDAVCGWMDNTGVVMRFSGGPFDGMQMAMSYDATEPVYLCHGLMTGMPPSTDRSGSCVKYVRVDGEYVYEYAGFDEMAARWSGDDPAVARSVAEKDRRDAADRLLP